MVCREKEKQIYSELVRTELVEVSNLIREKDNGWHYYSCAGG